MRQQRTLSRLTSTLTKNASVSPLTSTLTKTKDLKSFNINTYKKGVGPPVTSHESQVAESSGATPTPHSGILIRDNGILHRMNTLRIVRLRQTAVFLALLFLGSVSGRAQAPHAAPYRAVHYDLTATLDPVGQGI